jgi:beta-galactosidase
MNKTVYFLSFTLAALIVGTHLYTHRNPATVSESHDASIIPIETAKYKSFIPGAIWNDTDGNVINVHGGGIIQVDKKYYWVGEKRGRKSSEGVNMYSSSDLYNWKYEGVALPTVADNPEHDLADGCKIERPKVIYNEKTKKYVMWFHLELRGKGYAAARAAVAVSDQVTGPYQYVSSFRPNGNMSRDMTLYQEPDGTAYHMYSSNENYDLRICKLSDDYLTATTQDSLLFKEHREAPALFKYNNMYYLITSGCTGWTPNAASLHTSKSLWGPWKRYESPLRGPGAETTFKGQSTYILPVGKKDQFIFIADRWNPEDLKASSYLWLPIDLKGEFPTITWKDEWDFKTFSEK